MSDSKPYHAPPRAAEWLLARMFPDQGHYSTLGDLAEVYNHLAETQGVRRARAWYWTQALRSIGSFLVTVLYWGGIMFRNYVTIALRNLRRQKVYTLINVFGLALAIACIVLIYYFVRSEVTYDTFHPRYQDVYRVTTTVHYRQVEQWERTPYPLATVMAEQVPGLEAVARLVSIPGKILHINEQILREPVHLAGPTFFDIFDFPLERGDPSVILADPEAVIISKAVQEKYFARRDPIGARLSINLRDDVFTEFTIQGVAASIPENSSIQFDFLLSEQLYPDMYGERSVTDWMPKTLVSTFLRAAPQVRQEDLQANIEKMAEVQELGSMLRVEAADNTLPLQPLQAVHLSKEVRNVLLKPNGDTTYLYILGMISVLVLLVACINFVNLAVGLSTSRSKEVGMRKVLGAQPGQLIRQFWFESCVLSLLALVFGLGLAHLFLPTFNRLAGKSLVLDYYNDGMTIAMLVGLTVGVALLSGLYPAVILSRFKPVAVLKGVLKLRGGNFFSRAMITFQFTLSIGLIACTLLMSDQLQHISRYNLGFDAEQLIYHRLMKPADEALVERYRAVAGQHPNVVGIAATRATLTGDGAGSLWAVTFQGESTTLPSLKIDYDFIDVMDIDLVAGRNLSREHPGDQTGSVLVNEKFLEVFGVEDPIGQPLPFEGAEPSLIVGVVKDFHFQSLRKDIEPLILHLRPDSDYREIITRIRGNRIPETLAYLQATWEGLNTGTLFEYTFFDEVVQNQYEAERHFRTISAYASYFAILIACLGLFGLTALSVAQRTKEMGIRKVLGASVGRILLLFNKEYLYLLLIANLIAWPATYYVMTWWLESFAYRIDIGPGLFVLAGLIVCALAVLTITTQALRTAHINPVDTLRYE